ncbi:MAG TPA: alternative ribosome rescue aminoacyl-tRNA hydrolase ArfB [Chitinophagaceae bacterium]|nr:alternative ribosome rescue aminoacyl-tRNA hydrolase ArfB [Chitinophagaceae bacterium]
MIDCSAEFTYKTARSGGKGGQNVNKVETLVEARWHVASSSLLGPEQITLIISKLAKSISKEGYLMVQNSESRSQLSNKENARNKLLAMINKALIVPKKRKVTKVPRSVVEERLSDKKIRSEKKMNRKRDFE